MICIFYLPVCITVLTMWDMLRMCSSCHILYGTRNLNLLYFHSLFRDNAKLETFFCLQDLTWAPYELAKTVSRTFLKPMCLFICCPCGVFFDKKCIKSRDKVPLKY